MARLVVAAAARRDVREILTTLNRIAGTITARRYAARFKATYRYIAQYPAAGAHRAALGQHALIRVVHPFLIIYDYVDDEATILRVVDGRRAKVRHR
jgi:plasmid stabilization system protein ParE